MIILSRLYDVLHFGIVKSGKIMQIIVAEISLLHLVNRIFLINVYHDEKNGVKATFGKTWKKMLESENPESIHWTGPIWRRCFLLLPRIFALCEPLVEKDPLSVILKLYSSTNVFE